MQREPDPLLDSLKTLLRVAGEALESAHDRDYAKTRELLATRARVAVVGSDYRRALRGSGKAPSETYRCMTDLDRNVSACLREMDSVQSAADEEVILRLKRAHALATEFTTAADREEFSGR